MAVCVLSCRILPIQKEIFYIIKWAINLSQADHPFLVNPYTACHIDLKTSVETDEYNDKYMSYTEFVPLFKNGKYDENSTKQYSEYIYQTEPRDADDFNKYDIPSGLEILHTY